MQSSWCVSSCCLLISYRMRRKGLTFRQFEIAFHLTRTLVKTRSDSQPLILHKHVSDAFDDAVDLVVLYRLATR